MHARGLTHAKYMYYYWANWGLLIGITCNINSGTPITITWRYLNVIQKREMIYVLWRLSRLLRLTRFSGHSVGFL